MVDRPPNPDEQPDHHVRMPLFLRDIAELTAPQAWSAAHYGAPLPFAVGSDELSRSVARRSGGLFDERRGIARPS